MGFDQDILITSVGWANSYYGEGDEYVDEWGVSWQSVAYATPFGVGHYTEPRGHPLADAGALARYQPPDPSRTELYADAHRLIAQHRDEYWIVGSSVYHDLRDGVGHAGAGTVDDGLHRRPRPG